MAVKVSADPAACIDRFCQLRGKLRVRTSFNFDLRGNHIVFRTPADEHFIFAGADFLSKLTIMAVVQIVDSYGLAVGSEERGGCAFNSVKGHLTRRRTAIFGDDLTDDITTWF